MQFLDIVFSKIVLSAGEINKTKPPFAKLIIFMDIEAVKCVISCINAMVELQE